MKDREDDDDMKKRMGYFKQDSKGREQVDKQIKFQQGKRTEQRMPVMGGESKSKCYPSQYYDGDMKYMGGKNGKMHSAEKTGDMMGKMVKEGMDKMAKGGMDGMMKGGMQGMKGMMDKMDGMEGMLDKMGKMSEKDQLEMHDKLKNIKDGKMDHMMKGGMDGMKDGMKDMMEKKMHSMMQMKDGKQDMMSMMGSKEDMMEMMGMMKG